MNKIYFGDNLEILCTFPDESVNLIYIDPPFNTGKQQKSTQIKTRKKENGDRIGFQGNSYETIEIGTKSYIDSFGSAYIDEFLRPRIEQAYRVLTADGSLYFHIDYREVHYCKILLDQIFGRDSFLNEIIWAYDYGGKAKSRWPTKHDNILFYVKNPKQYIFNTNEIVRIPYMAPGLVSKEKAERGKLPTDTWWYGHVGKKTTDSWWHSIVGTNSNERTGYPTQKPIDILDRIITVSSLPGQTVVDFFAGSGTTGESCLKNNREFILIDNNEDAMIVMANRFSNISNIQWIGFNPELHQGNIQKIDIVNNSDKKFDADFISLLSLASAFQQEIEIQSDIWKNSPFEWLLQLSAAKKGKLGRYLIKSWLNQKGLVCDYSIKRGINFIIEGIPVSSKFSTIWDRGEYAFQQIRDNGYKLLICLGISPDKVHCWVFRKEYIIQHAKIQHKKGSEFWIQINPEDIPPWAQDYGGNLENSLNVLKKLLEELREEDNHGNESI